MLTPCARKCRRLAVHHDAVDTGCLHHTCRQTVDVQREHSVVALAYGDGRPDSPSRARTAPERTRTPTAARDGPIPGADPRRELPAPSRPTRAPRWHVGNGARRGSGTADATRCTGAPEKQPPPECSTGSGAHPPSG